MKMLTSPAPLTLAVGVLIAVVAIALGFLTLSAAVQPRAFSERVAEARQSLQAIRGTMPGSSATKFGPKAVCQGSLLAAEARLKSDLAARASAGRVMLKTLSTGPGAQGAGLAAIDISVTAEGDYGALTAYLAGMEFSAPEVFVDSVQLHPVGSTTSLSLKGRAFCWSSARR